MPDSHLTLVSHYLCPYVQRAATLTYAQQRIEQAARAGVDLAALNALAACPTPRPSATL